jgi:hypothetical protein
MDQQRPPDGWDPHAERPLTLQVTVVPGPRGAGLRELTEGLRRAVPGRLIVAFALVAVALAGIGALVVALAPAGRAHPAPAVHAATTPLVLVGISPADDPVAQTDREPLRCVRFTVDSSDSSYLLATRDYASTCARYSAWVPTVMHKVKGVWQSVLVGTTHPCPVPSVPFAVQVQLGICGPAGASAPLTPRAAINGGDLPRADG